MRSNDYPALLKSAGLVGLGGLAASFFFYLRAPKLPAAGAPGIASIAEAPPQTSLEPMDLSSNPRPVKARAEPVAPPEAVAADPVIFTGEDQRYHEAVLEGLDATDTFAQESAFCSKLGEWIRKSPEAVEAMVSEISQRYGPNTALRVTAQLWAEEDPEGAKEWALRSGNGGQRLKIIASVSYQLAQRDPVAALDSVKAELERTPYYETAAAPLVARWAGQDRAAALAWVNAQTEGDIRNQLLWHIQQAGAPANPWVAQQP